jgi:ABC-2 type transport system ATP-binding protein
MDEPTASLDPDIADKTLEIIENLKKDRNLSILYTSHNMKEVDRICDRIIFLNHGEIFAEDTPSGLTKKMEAISLEEAFIQIVRKKQHVDQKN